MGKNSDRDRIYKGIRIRKAIVFYMELLAVLPLIRMYHLGNMDKNQQKINIKFEKTDGDIV